MERIRARPHCYLGEQNSELTQRSEHTLDITRSRVGQSSYTRCYGSTFEGTHEGLGQGQIWRIPSGCDTIWVHNIPW